MFNNRGYRLALLASLVSGAVAVPAFAEEAPAAPKVVEEIVVTGSRIARDAADESTPVLLLGQDALQNQGFTNIADLTQTLPQFAPAFGESRTQSTFSGVAASGLNRANLRNAGSVRTVTLLNGRRVPGGSATSPAVDFNTMPTANIDRIEIMTGGASAIYGADAVAGVINIITKKDFNGLQLDASYGEAVDNSDNENPSYSVMWGDTFGEGGHTLFTLQYTEQGQVSCADRTLCADDFFWPAPTDIRYGPNARSGVPAGGRYIVGATSYTTRNGSITDANGNLIPFSVPIDGYNRNADRDIAIDTSRTLAAVEVTYPLTDTVRVFGEVNYGRADIDSGFEAHPFQSSTNFFGGGPGRPGLPPSIPVNNPFVPTALRNAIIAVNPAQTEITWFQRFNQLDNRGADSSRDTVRFAGGFQGEFESIAEFGKDWSWEVAGVWGQTSEDLGTEGLVSTGNLYYGLRVEPDPANVGQFRCIDPGARAIGCIPVNPFLPYTQAQKDYLRLDSSTRGESELNDVTAWLSGTVAELPAGPLNVAVGAEYRTFSGFRDYDNIINNALATGNQISDIDNNESKTTEAYIETVVPVVKDMFLVHSLDVEGAIRYSDTDDLGSYETWKAGFTWAPIEDVHLRAMKARAVRVPTPGELSGIGQTFGVVNDPCTVARRNSNPTRAANCTTDGVPATYDPVQAIQQSVGGLTGGNPLLTEEESDTFTYGVVWTPSFAEGLTVTVDRFEIDIDGAIASVARQTAVDLCYDTVGRSNCAQITRGTSPLAPGANYVLTAVDEVLVNINEYNIKGTDVSVNYLFDLDNFGAFNANLNWTIYDQADQVQPQGDVLDLKGIAGGSTADQGYIENQAVLNLGWRLDAFSANWNMRYVGSAEMGLESEADGFPQLDSVVYHNVNVAYDFMERSRVYVGANNLFDTDPPFLCSGCSGTQALDTIPGYYDVYGLTVYAGITFMM